jgi:uracil-DNA glycosylase family 4
MNELPFDNTTHFQTQGPKPVFINEIPMADIVVKKMISSAELKASVYNCFACPLNTYQKPLPMANMEASLMVIGSQPQDVSFETEQGKLLGELLKSFEIDFDDVYFTSAVKCEGSTSYSECHHHLIAEMIVVQPLVAIALGYNAGHQLLSSINPGAAIVPGQTGTLPTGTDMVITNSIADSMDDLEFIKQHLYVAKTQLLRRKESLRNEGLQYVTGSQNIRRSS